MLGFSTTLAFEGCPTKKNVVGKVRRVIQLVYNHFKIRLVQTQAASTQLLGETMGSYHLLELAERIGMSANVTRHAFFFPKSLFQFSAGVKKWSKINSTKMYS